jgi:hypothetical protein
VVADEERLPTLLKKNGICAPCEPARSDGQGGTRPATKASNQDKNKRRNGGMICSCVMQYLGSVHDKVKGRAADHVVNVDGVKIGGDTDDEEEPEHQNEICTPAEADAVNDVEPGGEDAAGGASVGEDGVAPALAGRGAAPAQNTEPAAGGIGQGRHPKNRALLKSFVYDKAKNTVGGQPNPATPRALFDENFSVTWSAIADRAGAQYRTDCGRGNFVYGLPAVSCTLLAEVKVALTNAGETELSKLPGVAPWTTTLLPGRYYVSALEQADEGIGGTTVCITVGEPKSLWQYRTDCDSTAIATAAVL